MGKKITYCEMEYWQKLYQYLNKSVKPFDDDYVQVECAVKMVKAIGKSSAIYFDKIKDFDKARIEQQLLRRFVDRAENVEGYPEVNCEGYQCLPNIKNDSLSAIFLSESHIEEAKDLGVMAIDMDQTSTNTSLYRDFGKSISKKEQLSWSEILKKAKHNCNAMVMFDNYILNMKEDNLFKILDVLLPQKLDDNVPFDLSIYTFESRNLEEEYKNICKKIGLIRANLKLNLTIYRCGKDDFHDRAIITNYMWIGCGGGFDLLKKDKRGFHNESGKTTTIPMIYIDLQDSSDWVSDAYSNFINDAKRINRNNMHFGSGTNRLVD